MNIQEASQVLRYISTAFPSYRPQYNDEMMADAIELWCGSFDDIPFPIVAEAVKKYVKQKHEFAPSIGQITTIINDMMGNVEMSESEAWNMVLVALRNGIYGAEEEFEKLPEEIQEAIGSPHYLREVASSEDINYSVESSNFYRNLRTIRERRRNQANISPKVQALIDQINSGIEIPVIENKQEVAMLEAKDYYEDAYARTVDKFLNGESENESSDEMINRQKGFADTLRERLNMSEDEPTIEPEPEEYDDYAIIDEEPEDDPEEYESTDVWFA